MGFHGECGHKNWFWHILNLNLAVHGFFWYESAVNVENASLSRMFGLLILFKLFATVTLDF